MENTAVLRILAIFIVGCIWQPTANGQFILNQDGQAFQSLPFFNTAFVKAMGVRELKGKIYTMRTGDVMRETKGTLCYVFNKQGQLTRTQWFKPYNNHKDSITYEYAYDQQGHCNQILLRGEIGNLNTKFEFEGNTLRSKVQLLPVKSGEAIVLNSEIYETTRTDSIEITKSKNQYNLVFSKSSKVWNEMGYLTTKSTIGTMSHETTWETYEYNTMGKLSSRSIYFNDSKDPNQQFCYSYDLVGNLIEVSELKNGQPYQEIQLIYNNKTMLLSSMIFIDNLNQFLEIVRF